MKWMTTAPMNAHDTPAMFPPCGTVPTACRCLSALQTGRARSRLQKKALERRSMLIPAACGTISVLSQSDTKLPVSRRWFSGHTKHTVVGQQLRPLCFSRSSLAIRHHLSFMAALEVVSTRSVPPLRSTFFPHYINATASYKGL